MEPLEHPLNRDYPHIHNAIVSAAAGDPMASEIINLISEVSYLRGWKEGATGVAEPTPPTPPAPQPVVLKPRDQWIFLD